MLTTILISLMSMWDPIAIGRACRAGLAGFGLVILSASLADAGYGPRTIVGEHYQQTSTTTSSNGINEGSCTSRHDCYILFQPAPQQKALTVQHVSCYVYVSGGVLRYGFLGAQQGGAHLLRRKHLVPVRTNGTTYSTDSIVNGPVTHLVKPGERPYVYLRNSVAGSTWLVECDISGQLQQ